MENNVNCEKNPAVEKTVGGVEVIWRDVIEAPFMLHGLLMPDGELPFYHRVPKAVAEATSAGVTALSRESAGGRVRFATDSPYIAIRAKFCVVGRSPHLTFCSSAGFDLYTDGAYGSKFIRPFLPSLEMKDGYESVIDMKQSAMRTYTVNFPVHSVVVSLEIGLKPGAVLGAPEAYRDYAPISFYGSSIVHGTAATRPGLTYSSVISRELNLDFRNIGFSGMAKGEEAIARWMAQLPMSVFVCDYDHNAPTVEHLRDTHYRLYEIIREKNPTVPYIMVTRPDYYTRITEQEHILLRRDVIMESYLKARAAGDKNVYFVDGLSFSVAPHQYEYSTDSVHPNDSGFLRMADAIGTVIRHALEKGK
ncbi:MAG: hypothetical protein IJD79_01530 [Clostridia bacterium]|nr:hypothetical protein [Clostridia bacterium]